MRWTTYLASVIAVVLTATAQAQVGSPGIDYGNSIGAGDGVQLYPYDQQDTWLHGHFQRVPSYGGFSSFRPYNYRHVFAQTQLAQSWGHAHGMPYSQQFWNRYRGSYMDGNLHSNNQPVMQSPQVPAYPTPGYPAYASPSQAYPTQGPPAQGYPNYAYPVGSVRPIAYETQGVLETPTNTESQMNIIAQPTADQRPVHIFPERMNKR